MRSARPKKKPGRHSKLTATFSPVENNTRHSIINQSFCFDSLNRESLLPNIYSRAQKNKVVRLCNCTPILDELSKKMQQLEND